ncbi:PadR family transcriptional regulator, partial [Streptococcus suis]|nr:PadR family transcriptional regulator [Streptococcus suis]
IENLLKLKLICSVTSSYKRRKVYQVTETGKEIINLETQRIQKLHHIDKELGFK